MPMKPALSGWAEAIKTPTGENIGYRQKLWDIETIAGDDGTEMTVHRLAEMLPPELIEKIDGRYEQAIAASKP